MFIHIYVYIYLYLYKYIYIYTYMYTYIYIYVYMDIYNICIYKWIDMYTYIRIYKYVAPIYIYVYVCICTYAIFMTHYDHMTAWPLAMQSYDTCGDSHWIHTLGARGRLSVWRWMKAASNVYLIWVHNTWRMHFVYVCLTGSKANIDKMKN